MLSASGALIANASGKPRYATARHPRGAEITDWSVGRSMAYGDGQNRGGILFIVEVSNAPPRRACHPFRDKPWAPGTFQAPMKINGRPPDIRAYGAFAPEATRPSRRYLLRPGDGKSRGPVAAAQHKVQHHQ